MALEYPHHKIIGSVAKEEHVKLVFKIRFVFKKQRVSRNYDFETLSLRKAQTVARGGLHY